MKIHESEENYLENILVLKDQNGEVRSIDIVNKMGFSKPSVSVAMKNLREKGYIEVNDKGFITLTSTGFEIAKNIYERHTLLSKALMALGVSEETAKQDACLIEHDLSQESFEKIKEHICREQRIECKVQRTES